MSTANTLTSGLDCASPESIMEPTNRTPAGDQYSLGCVLYYCLTGPVPFPEGTAVEKMMAHQTKEPTPIRELAPDVPDGLRRGGERLMAKTPEAGTAACDEVVEALEPYARRPVRTGSRSGRRPALRPAATSRACAIPDPGPAHAPPAPVAGSAQVRPRRRPAHPGPRSPSPAGRTTAAAYRTTATARPATCSAGPPTGPADRRTCRPPAGPVARQLRPRCRPAVRARGYPGRGPFPEPMPTAIEPDVPLALPSRRKTPSRSPSRPTGRVMTRQESPTRRGA